MEFTGCSGTYRCYLLLLGLGILTSLTQLVSYLRKYINRPFVLWFTINVFLALYPRLGNVNWHGSDGGDEPRYHAGHEVTEDPVLDVACNRWLQPAGQH